MNTVIINVRFSGNIARALGKEQMSLETSCDLESAICDVKCHMKDAPPDLLYTMLIGGMHYSIAIKQGIKLEDGDEILVIPVTLGG